MKYKILLLIITTTITISCSNEHTDNQQRYSFTKKGELIRPKNYREWIYVGSAATPKSHDPNALFPDFQNAYINPEGYKFWKKNGYYKEKTIFVKELLRKGDTIAPVGRGFFQGDFYSLSATIKDTILFPDAPGGWEYFKFTNSKEKILNETSPAVGNSSCIDCHSRSKSGLGPFTEYYSVLRAAKGFGEGNPENKNTRKGL